MFKVQITTLKKYMVWQIEEARGALTTIIKGIKSNDKNGEIYTGTRLIKDEALDFYNQYLGSTSTLMQNMEKTVQMIQNGEITKSDEYEVILQFQPDSSTFFPTLTIIKKKGKGKTK